ncbi:EcsC family protein [Terrisporobacter sp.]|uniref:EcsC family protein n=1 Tax=Terrisporobacter sp. TaxID=1965305 RepID=UPI00262E969B|nr:EcsC family protein [Terrisporobacter sp.]
MKDYILQSQIEHKKWKKEIRKKVSIIDRITSSSQKKFNSLLPEKYHEIVTSAVKNMVKSVLFGYQYITKEPYKNLSLKEREDIARNKINYYRKSARIEGVATGAAGLLVGLADFPLLLGIKVKLLYDLAAIYGFDVRDYKERLYILYIIQLSFSSRNYGKKIFDIMENWDEYSENLPNDINNFDWKSFQQEYRDYLDLAKLLQLVPGIGAAVGFYVNGKLLNKLGETAINSYRMRLELFRKI